MFTDLGIAASPPPPVTVVKSCLPLVFRMMTVVKFYLTSVYGEKVSLREKDIFGASEVGRAIYQRFILYFSNVL